MNATSDTRGHASESERLHPILNALDEGQAFRLLCCQMPSYGHAEPAKCEWEDPIRGWLLPPDMRLLGAWAVHSCTLDVGRARTSPAPSANSKAACSQAGWLKCMRQGTCTMMMMRQMGSVHHWSQFVCPDDATLREALWYLARLQALLSITKLAPLCHLHCAHGSASREGLFVVRCSIERSAA
jgi:hypothetical protein